LNFLCTRAEIDWFLYGMRQFFPEAHEEFVALIPPAERVDVLQAYSRRLFGSDPDVSLQAARAWCRYEGRCLFLRAREDEISGFESAPVALGIGRLEAHYFLHGGFMQEDALIRNMACLAHLPAMIVQGRYDVVCPPASAWRLHRAWPGSRLRLIADAGHAALEPGTAAALVAATESFRLYRSFEDSAH